MTVEALVTIGDRRVRITSVGAGPPLLIFTGPGTASAELQGLLQGLSDIAQLVGLEPSDPDGQIATDADVEVVATRAEHIRVALGLGEVIVFGHSTGAFVAVEYARRYPDHVAGLALCLAGVEIADPLAEIDKPALIISTPHHIDLVGIVRNWLVADALPCQPETCHAIGKNPPRPMPECE